MHAAAPPLPPAEIRAVEGTGELFVRFAGAETGAMPVLLIHGWQATADVNFYPLYSTLAQRGPVISPDLRGHGRSVYSEEPFTIEAAADDCAALLRDVGIDRAIVVGYSLGTAVAQMMVKRHPDVVGGLVLAAGELRRRGSMKFLNPLGGWVGTFQRLTAGRRAAHAIVSKAAAENPAVEQIRPWLVSELERGHAASMRQAGRALARFDGGPISAGRETPVVVVVTTRDRLVPPHRQRLLANAWRAPVVELDADHDSPIAQPAALTTAVLQAIESLERNLVGVKT